MAREETQSLPKEGEAWSRTSSLEGVAWSITSFLLFMGLFILVREVLPRSVLDTYIDRFWILSVWMVLSFIMTLLVVILLARFVRSIRETTSMR